MQSAKKGQTREDRRRIIASLPPETKRVQVISSDGRTQYKRPDEVSIDSDEIILAADGTPVIMRGRPGRRPKVALQPVTQNIAEVQEARGEHVEGDPLLTAARGNPEGDEVLNSIIVAMAEESAAVEFERLEAERHGVPTSNISAKRARILKGMADTYLKRRDKIDGEIDLDSKTFEVLFGFILETVKDTMSATGMRPELIETVFSKLGKTLNDSWKAEATARMKQ
jgi:hypothetical protein